MAKKSSLSIGTAGQYKWNRNKIEKELLTGVHISIGFGNEMRLAKLIELLDYYVEKYGIPEGK